MVFNQIVNYEMNDDMVNKVFAALADPTRRQILARLSEGSATVSELAAPHSMSLPAISKHLKVLERAGLVSKTVKAQERECHLEPTRLQLANEWLERYRDQWTASFNNLETYLEEVKHK